MADRDRIESFAARVRDEQGLAQFLLLPRGKDVIELTSLIVAREHRGQGRGSRAMESLIDFADRNGLRLFLTPGLPNSYHGTTSRSRLVAFYKRFGFYENRGRKKDFSFMGGMLRDPEPVPELSGAPRFSLEEYEIRREPDETDEEFNERLSLFR